jgi:hypothetical protein
MLVTIVLLIVQSDNTVTSSIEFVTLAQITVLSVTTNVLMMSALFNVPNVTNHYI